MRLLSAILFAGLVTTFVSAAEGGAAKVEVKGPHICCKQCVNVVNKILSKVDGVSEVVADAKTKTVTFNAKDAGAAKAGFKALVDGGFFGTGTADGKEIKLEIPATAKGEKTEAITVADVHVCCGACKSAVNKVFSDAKVTYEGTGPQLTVRIAGPGLEASDVIEALRKAGFNGTIKK